MLEVLFGGRCTPRQVIQILEDEYEFAHAHTMERTVSEMCNLSQGIFEEGMEKGMKQGMAKGEEVGKSQRSIEIAKNMLAKGMDEATIQEITGLTEDQILQIQ